MRTRPATLHQPINIDVSEDRMEYLKSKFNHDVIGEHDEWMLDFTNKTIHLDNWFEADAARNMKAALDAMMDRDDLEAHKRMSYDDYLDCMKGSMTPGSLGTAYDERQSISDNLKQLPGILEAGAISVGISVTLDLAGPGATKTAFYLLKAGFKVVKNAAGKVKFIKVRVDVPTNTLYSNPVPKITITRTKPHASFNNGGVLNAGRYAQTSYSSTFSAEGIRIYSRLAGRPINTIDDLVGAIRAGHINPSQIEVNYIVRPGGRTLILNTRTGQALEQAGIPRSQWNSINRTGDPLYERLLSEQLQRNNLTNNGIANPVLDMGR